MAALASRKSSYGRKLTTWAFEESFLRAIINSNDNRNSHDNENVMSNSKNSNHRSNNCTNEFGGARARFTPMTTASFCRRRWRRLKW